MSSHAHPSPEQLKPMVQHNQAMWSGFTKAIAIGAAAVVVLLSLMLVFLVKHS